MNRLLRPVKEFIGLRAGHLLERLVLYTLRKLIGEFTTLTPDQVVVRGLEVSVNDVELNPKAVNAALGDFPLEVVEGFVRELCTTVPWGEFGTSPLALKAKGLDLTLRPKAPINNAAKLFEDMKGSLMTASLQCMEEALKDDGKKSAQDQVPEVSDMAAMLEKIKALVHVSVEDITLRLEDVTDDNVIGLDFHVDKLEYFDDRVRENGEKSSGSSSSVDFDDQRSPLAWVLKNVRMYGIQVNLDDDQSSSDPTSVIPDPADTSPPELFISALESVADGDEGPRRHWEEEPEEEEEEVQRATPVTIAVLPGLTEIKIRTKEIESIEGPKVEVDGHLGALHTLLSPKQLGYITQILSSFLAPAKSSMASSPTDDISRRMGPDDYRKVDLALQHNLGEAFEDLMDPHSNDNVILADGQPQFFTMEPMGRDEMNLSTSSLDTVGTATTKATSVFAPSTAMMDRQHKTAHKAKEDRGRASVDGVCERNSYQVSVAMVSVCVLHEEPHAGCRKQWLAKMAALTADFFQGVRRIPTIGHALSLAQLRDRVSAILPRDHLGLLCKPLTLTMQDKTLQTGQSFSLDLNVGSAELVECLYDNTKRGNSFSHQDPTRLPQYSEILTFPNSQSAPATFELLSGSMPSPALRLNATITSKTGPFGHMLKETEVSLQLGAAVTEVDITMQDRLTSLLNTLSSPKPPPPQFGQSLLAEAGLCEFEDAMQDVGSRNVLTINVSCPHTTLRIRFPIPDLRPGNQHAPREWWGRNLHKESLLLEVDSLSLLRRDSPEVASSQPSVTETMCSKLEVYFQEDFNKTPVLFGSIQQGSGDVGNNFNRPRVVVKSFPALSTLLDAAQREERGPETLDDYGSMMGQDMMRPRAGATPFSVKREVAHGATHLEGDEQEGFQSTFEKVIPGTKEECRKFVDMSSSNTNLLVEITAPKFLILLHNKSFVELLYNRINNDLLLWEPQSPSPPENFASGLSLNVQPQMGFMGNMSQSVYKPNYDSESDSEDDGSPRSHGEHFEDTTLPLPSNLCLSVCIGEGKVFANVPIKDEEEKVVEGFHGELMLLVRDALLFVSVGHEGDKDLRYLTFNANNAILLHAGCVDDHKVCVRMEHLDLLSPDTARRFQHMADRIYRAAQTVPVAPLASVGVGEASEDMVCVAVKIKVDTPNNSKYFCVAAAVKGGTLRLEKFHKGENWISQVMELLDLTDYPIEGYVMPEVITDLHIELQGCSVDYRTPVSPETEERLRPKNFPLPMRALLTAQKFNLNVNLNAETQYTSLRFILEEARLWLSDKDFMEIRLEKDYLTMAYNSLLEIGLRLGQAKEEESHTLLWFSCSKTELGMCADSCAALTLLIQHFLNDGDIKTPEQRAAEEEHIEEMRRSLTESLEEDESMVARQRQVEKMVAEALMEHPKPQASPSDSPERQEGGAAGRELYFIPPGREAFPPADSPVPSPAQGGPLGAGGHQGWSAPIMDFQDEDEEDSDCGEGFTIISSPGLGIAPREGELPVVRWYTEGKRVLDINKDFLHRLSNNTLNELKTPSDYPVPNFKTVIREWNLDISFYGGNDFNLHEGVMPTDKTKEDPHGRQAPVAEMWRGGINRNHALMTKLSFCKFRLNYETYAEEEERSRRLVVLVKALEIHDNVKSSKYHKLLYWPNSSLGHEGSNMVCLKMLWERPFQHLSTEECSIMLTLQPLKVNVNQDTLLFMQHYFAGVATHSNNITFAAVPHGNHGNQPSPSPSPSHSLSSDSSAPREKMSSGSREPAPILTVTPREEEEEEEGVCSGEDNLIHLDDFSPSPSRRKSSKTELPHRQNLEPKDAPMFIKSFVLTRPVPLSIDYCGTTSNINSKDGLITLGVSMAAGLLSLENAQIWLKNLELVKGYVGTGKLVEAVFKEWVDDIERTQKIRIMGGVPILGAFKLLGDGLYEFLTSPYIQWQRDGRIWRGFQKGASSLGSAAQLAVIDLLQIIFDTLQVISECGYDFLSSGKSVRSYQPKIGPPPKDMRDGMTEACNLLLEGMKGTVSNLVTSASKQREQKGLAGAMGTATKEGTALVIGTTNLAATAIRRVCTTYKYNLHPEAQQEDKEKWKSHN